MIQLIGIALALTLTLAVVPVLAAAHVTGSVALVLQPNPSVTGGTTIVTPSGSTNPSASAYAPGHGATPPGQGGTPPGQAKPDLDEDDLDPTGLLGAADEATRHFGHDIIALD
jgi:hypothetical protein